MAGRFSALLQRANPMRYMQNLNSLNPKLKLPSYSAGSPNLEVAKFGIYIMFPIGWMYYFGTNLENRFTVPDFWPAAGTTHKIPFEREDQIDMDKKLRELRLLKKERRKERERLGLSTAEEAKFDAITTSEDEQSKSEVVVGSQPPPPEERIQARTTFGISAIERWARGK